MSDWVLHARIRLSLSEKERGKSFFYGRLQRERASERKREEEKERDRARERGEEKEREREGREGKMTGEGGSIEGEMDEREDRKRER